MISLFGVRYYRVVDSWVYADAAGWLPGSSRSLVGALLSVQIARMKLACPLLWRCFR